MHQKSGIYTKQGDNGMTSLGDKRKLSKSHYRISAIGSLDELNSVIGMYIGCSISCATNPKTSKFFHSLQDDLFAIGAHVGGIKELELDSERLSYIEEKIDEVSANLNPLHNFVLPGGRVGACWLHFARTVCRRAERELVYAQEQDGDIDQIVLTYINRLSDLLFVFARKDNDGDDILWRP